MEIILHVTCRQPGRQKKKKREICKRNNHWPLSVQLWFKSPRLVQFLFFYLSPSAKYFIIVVH
jgi:hypothetical protein